MLESRGQTTTVRRIDAHDPAEHNQRADVGRRMGTVLTANRNGRARNPESTEYREARVHLIVLASADLVSSIVPESHLQEKIASMVEGWQTEM